MINLVNTGIDRYSIDILQKNKIIIYGAGSMFHWVLEILMISNRIIPEIIIDNKFTNPGYKNGIKAVSYDFFVNNIKHNINDLVIISIKDKLIRNDIKSKFEILGFKNIINLQEIYAIHNPFDAYLEINEHIGDIEEAYEFISDRRSKIIFENLINIHLTKTPTAIDSSPEEEQFFPSDIPRKDSAYRIIQCGSGIFDINNILINCGDKIQELICFDPDTNIFFGGKGYLGIVNFLKDINLNITAYNKAVSNFSGSAKFKSSGYELGMREYATSFGSRIDPAGNEAVEVVYLDQFIENKYPTHIFIDAEGEDLNILRGAQRMIQKYQPDIGVSVYHKISHLWEVILFLKRIHPVYNIYIRNYTGLAMETVVYATTA